MRWCRCYEGQRAEALADTVVVYYESIKRELKDKDTVELLFIHGCLL